MSENSISLEAIQFLTSYAYFVRDPQFYPKDSVELQSDRFRIRHDGKAWFKAGKQSAWVSLHANVLSELHEASFIQLISSGDHFVTEEGWDFIRENIVRLRYD